MLSTDAPRFREASLSLLTQLVRSAVVDTIDRIGTRGLKSAPTRSQVCTYLSDLSKRLLDEAASATVQQLQVVESGQCIATKGFASAELLLNGIPARIYSKARRQSDRNPRLINVVLPCRNSDDLVSGALEFLASEMESALHFDFNVVVQINESSDTTLRTVLDAVSRQSTNIDTSNFYVVATPQDCAVSLPGSLNLSVTFLREAAPHDIAAHAESYFSFWDDELRRAFDPKHPRSLFEANLQALHESRLTRAVSAHMIDQRPALSHWHRLARGSASETGLVMGKPYLHGGAGALLRWNDYPPDGIPLGGIADTDLSAHLLADLDAQSLKRTDHLHWPVRTNPRFLVHHPCELDILRWTAKYLSYHISWDRTLTDLSRRRPRIAALWRQRIADRQRDYYKKVDQQVVSRPWHVLVDRLFMRSYYEAVAKLPNKPEIYSWLKLSRARSFDLKA